MRPLAFLIPVALLAAAETGRAQEYELTLVTPLEPSPSFPEAYLWDLNDVGQAVGLSTYQSSYAGLAWDSSTGSTPLGGGGLRGINNAGQVVAGAAVVDFDTGSVQHVIPGLSSAFATVFAQHVNDSGVVVGWIKGPGSDSSEVNRTAFWWDAFNGTQATSIPGAREFLRVNANNVAVGVIRPSAGAERGLVYDINTGASTNLSDLLVPDTYSESFDINDQDVVVGKGWNGAFTGAFTWHPSSGFTFLPGLQGGSPMDVHPRGINDDGTVVGWALIPGFESKAFVWHPATGMRALEDLVGDIPAGLELKRAWRINIDGCIVGDGQGGGPYFSTAFVLKPVTCQTDLGFGDTGGPTLTICGDPPCRPATPPSLELSGGPAERAGMARRIGWHEPDRDAGWHPRSDHEPAGDPDRARRPGLANAARAGRRRTADRVRPGTGQRPLRVVRRRLLERDRPRSAPVAGSATARS